MISLPLFGELRWYIERLLEEKEIFRRNVVEFPLSLEDDPGQWWNNFSRVYRRLRRVARDPYQPDWGNI
jgi:hypothetical protein